MIEFLFNILLELILLLIVSSVVIEYLQRLAMETIWGDPLGGTEDNPTTSGEDFEELAGVTDQANYIENAANTSSDEEDLHLTGSNLKVRLDKDGFDSAAPDKLKIENTTSDDEDLCGNEVNSSSATDEKYLSCNEDNLISTISDEDLSDEADSKSTTVQVKFNQPETTDDEDILNKDKSETTQVKFNQPETTDDEDILNKDKSETTQVKFNQPETTDDEDILNKDKSETTQVKFNQPETTDDEDILNKDKSETTQVKFNQPETTDDVNILNRNKSETTQVKFNQPETTDDEDILNKDKSETTQVKFNQPETTDDEDILNKDKSETTQVKFNQPEANDDEDILNKDKSETTQVKFNQPETTDDVNILNRNKSETTRALEDITDEINIYNEDKNKYIISVPLTTISKNEGDDFIKIVHLSNKMSKVYGVNGSSFVEGENLSQHDTDELAAYELYKMDKITKDEDDDEDMITTLDIHIQTLPQGVIINSNVFLWDAQWHTMALIDGQLFRCAICQVYCDRLTCDEHIDTISHLRNLDKFRPLKRFDLSIVRKINVDLHCGVCNEIFDIIDFKIHENGKKHEENLLTAINKVSDLMYDSNIHSAYKNRKFHSRNTSSFDRITSSSDRNTPSSDRNTPNSDRNTQSSGRNTSSYDRITSGSDRNVSTPERTLRNNGEYHFDANAINNNNINIYEEFSEEEEFSDKDEENEEFSEAEEANEEYSYEIEEYNTPFQGISYASMASKPTIELPKFLKIDLGTKEVRVKFESWHMIRKIASNQYYCMVCNTKDQIRFKSRHCISCEHVEKLAKCTIVRAFEDYLIRKVDDKLYHCGHCNNLQYQNQMEDHIESSHPKINRNYVESRNPVNTTKKTKTTDKGCSKTVIEPKKTESDKSAIINKNIEYEAKIDPPNINPYFNIFGDIPLTPFGCTLRIPVLYFNLVMKRDDDYYCVICDKVCTDAAVHLDEMGHVKLMTMTPFIKPFANNLTRAVRGMLHCSLCNKLFPVSEVYDHNIDQPHTTALATAMGMKKSQKPIKPQITILNFDNGPNSVHNQATPVLTSKNTLSPNVPSKDPAVTNLQRIQKENVKPVSPNQFTDQVSAQTTSIKTEITQNTQLPNSGPNFASQNYNAASAIARPNTQTGQNIEQQLMNILHVGQNTGPNLPQAGPKRQNLSNVGQNLPNYAQHLPNSGQNPSNTGQNLPQAGPNRQNLSNIGQNLSNSARNPPNTGQNLPYYVQHLPNSGQNLPNSEQHLPNTGQNLQQPRETQQNLSNSGHRFSFPQYNAQSIKSIPPMFNSMFPSLPPVNAEILKNQFVRPPLAYNFTAPRPSVSPFPIATPNNSPNLLSPQIPAYIAQNQIKKTQNNQEVGRKPVVITDRKYAASENDNSKCGSDNSKSGSDNSKSGSDNFKSGNDNVDNNFETDSESEEECKDFDEEEMVFLKLKTTYFKITSMSYNTLVFLDNGIRYCFVCSSMVSTSQEQIHVESRKHMECLADNKFLDKYGVQLFRQMYLMYHCAICNVLMTRKEIKLHLDWPGHVETYNAAHLILNKKNRRQLKSGLREYAVETQKEAIFHNVNEPNYHILAAYKIVPNLDVKKDALKSRPARGSKSTVVKKNKMVIQNNVVMKISFDHWHGITAAKNVTKCVICQMEITPDEVFEHVETEYHAVALGNTFDKTYYPALVRKINESTVNCMTCNLELPNNEYMIHEHANGRKHVKNQETILSETSHSDSYADCYEDYLNL